MHSFAPAARLLPCFWRPCDGCGADPAAVSVDGAAQQMDLSTHEMSGMYAGKDGTQLTLLWQQYRPLLGETAELSTGKAACLGYRA